MFLFFILIMSEEHFLQEAAGKLNMPYEELRMNAEDLEMYGYGRYRLKLFDNLVYRPAKVSPFLRSIAHSIETHADSLWALCYFPWARIDESVRRGLITRPDNELHEKLSAYDDLAIYLNTLLQQGYQTNTTLPVGTPDSLILGLSLILTQMRDCISEIDSALGHLSQSDIDMILKGLREEQEDGLSNRHIESLIDRTDYKYLSASFMDMGYVLQRTLPIIQKHPPANDIEIKTHYGMIVLDVSGDDRYEESPYLLIIDYGGNDEYISCGVTMKSHPVSCIIDYHGDDRYEGDIGPGTGIHGFACTIDMVGNDTYHSSLGLATGIFGQGILLDAAGNDIYTGDCYAQGAGLFGAGILSDLSGNDTYECFQCGQGFGFVKGAGILIDVTGNDTYIARDDSVKYPASQSKKHNASLSQGMGFGVRADFTDGHSLAGGVGLLIDGNGDDYYSCGIFGQGCAYWFAVGALIDFHGHDEYHGVWYVQGSGAHFGLGTLIDSTGNDEYYVSMSMSQGSGHDFTLGCLFDYQGDDYYVAQGLSLGGGNANGMGVFIDFTGNDTYETHGDIFLGRANIAHRGGLRDHMKCLGIFIDGAGKDIYTAPFAKNKSSWQQLPPMKPSRSGEKCLGIDF